LKQGTGWRPPINGTAGDDLADQEYAARLIRSGARRKSLARLKMEVTQDSQAV